MAKHYILCGDIQIPTEKDSSISKWLQRWQNLTFFVGTFKFRLKNSSVSKWFQRSQNFTSSVWTFKFQLKKKQFSIDMISKMTEPCILCGDIHVPTEKSVQHRNDSNYQRTFSSFVGTLKSQLKNTDYYWHDYEDDSPLHSLLGHSSFNWKKLTSFIRTFKIQLEKTVQYPNDFKDDRTLHSLWGHSNSNWKRQFSIDMISNITELYILWGEIQTPTEKDRLVLKWLQRWQNLTFFVRTFKFRLKKQFSMKMILKITELYIFCRDIQVST